MVQEKVVAQIVALYQLLWFSKFGNLFSDVSLSIKVTSSVKLGMAENDWSGQVEPHTLCMNTRGTIGHIGGHEERGKP